MSLSRHQLIVLSAAVLLATAVVGCKSSETPPTSAPPPKENWSSQPLATPPQKIEPVKSGQLPIAYIVESSCMVRIVDQTTNENLLVIPVQAKTIVSIDARSGIKIGTGIMKLGPLPADHKYGLFLESSTHDNYIERGTIRPGSQ